MSLDREGHSQMCRNTHEAAGEVAVSLGQGWLVSPVLCGDSC